MFVDSDKCEELGLDHKRVEAVAKRLSRAATEARALGLKVFGCAGSGELRLAGTETVVAGLDGAFDGGDN